MVERPSLSKAELEVARLVWERGSCSVRDIHELLSSQRDIEFATVQTYLRRLESKGYIKAKMEKRTRIYSPRVQRKTVIRETVDDLVQRLFGGDSMPLMVHLIEDNGVEPSQLAELRSLIDRLENESKEPTDQS